MAIPGRRARKNMCFTVIHFAGPVSYDGTNFMDPSDGLGGGLRHGTGHTGGDRGG